MPVACFSCLFAPYASIINACPSLNLFSKHSIAVEVRIGTTSIRVAAIDDLISLKRLSNRPQDRADIEKLQEIQRIRQEHQDE